VTLRVWDDRMRCPDIHVRNNLFLGAQCPDMVFIDSGGRPGTPNGFGDGRLVARAFAFGQNWREVRLPASPPKEQDGWIPRAESDTVRPVIDGIDRDPKSPAFLRPDAKSPLATEGAGKEDPTLPTYIGALPPEGAEPWDWDRTWRARTKPPEPPK
jgi:hypothetical protein